MLCLLEIENFPAMYVCKMLTMCSYFDVFLLMSGKNEIVAIF